MLTRFLGGVFGTASLAITGGTLADCFNEPSRSIALAIFSATAFIGPAMGPVVGSYITEGYLGWRWCTYITAILGFSSWTVGLFIVPETYAPVLLQRKAERLRHETQNWAIHSKIDEQPITLHTVIVKFLSRPALMLINEPILILLTIYLATIYGVLYLFLEAFPIAFHEVRHWEPTTASLPFIALAIGLTMGAAGVIWTTKVHTQVKVQKGTFKPEDRLPSMAVGGFLLPIGLFWFGWTSNPQITWVPQVISPVFIGAGIMVIFTQGVNYIFDVYVIYGNSAMAGNTMIRSIFASAFPLFATAMLVLYVCFIFAHRLTLQKVPPTRSKLGILPIGFPWTDIGPRSYRFPPLWLQN